ncbi:MAG: TonB-dependent receptor [Spirochaetaceae bacterium]|nr:TonB-dependent receptor [Spirochaetaceae bacterium]
MSNFKRTVGCMMAAVVVGFPLLAQDEAGNSGDGAGYSGDEVIVVTAAKVAQTTSEAVEKVTVITEQMIEEAGAHNLSDILNMIPGVTYTGTAQGSGEPLQMNGFSDEYVKVLVDGVPVNTGGTPNALQMLALDNVDHIEVMNGSASALYGSDAIAGVINIITKKGQDDQPFSFYVEQEGYTNMSFKNLSGKGLNGGAGASYYGDHFRAEVDGSYGVTAGTWEDKDGYVDDTGVREHDYDYKEYSTPRSYKYSMNGLVGWSFTEDRDLFAKLNWSSNDTQYWKTSDQTNAYSGNLRQSLMGSVHLDWAFDDRQSLSAFVAERWNRSIGNTVALADGTKKEGTPSWYNDVEVEALYVNSFNTWNQLMVGLNGMHTVYDNGAENYSSIQTALFAQDIMDFGRIQVTPGFRFTLLAPVKGLEGVEETVKWNISPKLGAKWEILDGLALRLGMGSGYRLPSSSQKYSTSSKGHGDPNLKPETS